jgi:hypothetical protein
MTTWFQCKIKYLKEADNGLIRTMNQTYLVDAMTFTEAESRLTEELADVLKEFTLMSASRSTIKEVVFYGDTPRWFKCKVTYSTMDEDGEKEKKVTTYILVNADNVKDAWDRLEEHLTNMQVPYQVPSIAESPIVEVMEYNPGDKKPKGKKRVADIAE